MAKRNAGVCETDEVIRRQDKIPSFTLAGSVPARELNEQATGVGE